MAETVEPKTEKRRLSLGKKILIGILAGVACGLFFGEICGEFEVLGHAFIGLLQMTVLPYIIVALIASFGRLSLGESKRLVTRAALVLVVLWVLGFVVILLLPLAFPEQETASFFSSSETEAVEAGDALSLYVPFNFFKSLSGNAVPAVVLFCICIGVALIGVKNKESLLEQLDVVASALMRVNAFVVKLTPYGVFFIAAAAAGTMELAEIARVQAYLVAYTVGVLLLTFVVLPSLVTACTPFTYRDILRAYQDPLITAFATAKVLVVLPQLIENTRKLFDDYGLKHPEMGSTTEAIFPLSYPFPHLGKLISLLFIPFAAWFVGRTMTAGDHATLVGSGLLSYFGGPLIALPFLLDSLQLPADMLQLFLVTGVYCARLGDLLGAMHLIALGLLTTCAVTGFLKIDWRRVGRSMGLSAGALALAILGTRMFLGATLKGSYTKDKVIAGMQLLEDPGPSVVVEPGPNPVALGPGERRLSRIRRRGEIRIGVHPQNLPFCFYNAKEDLVGFDVDMAHRLARDLGVSVEFVPFESDRLARQLEDDHFDIAMSGIVGTLERAEEMTLSESYLDVRLALLVRDYRRGEFTTAEEIRKIPDLKVGVGLTARFLDRIGQSYPNVEVVLIDSPAGFLDGTRDDLDALFVTAEGGSAWTLIHPQFEVVVPKGRSLALPLVYPLGPGDDGFKIFIDHWIALMRTQGDIRECYDYWILGRGAEDKGPRWSVIRNVLHWVD